MNILIYNMIFIYNVYLCFISCVLVWLFEAFCLVNQLLLFEALGFLLNNVIPNKIKYATANRLSYINYIYYFIITIIVSLQFIIYEYTIHRVSHNNPYPITEF